MEQEERFVPVRHLKDRKAAWYVWDNLKQAYGNAKLFGVYPTRKKAQCRIDNVVFFYKGFENQIP